MLKFIFVLIHFAAFKFIRSASRINLLPLQLRHGSENPCCYTMAQFALSMRFGSSMNHFKFIFVQIHFAEFKLVLSAGRMIFLPLQLCHESENPWRYTIAQLVLAMCSGSNMNHFLVKFIFVQSVLLNSSPNVIAVRMKLFASTIAPWIRKSVLLYYCATHLSQELWQQYDPYFLLKFVLMQIHFAEFKSKRYSGQTAFFLPLLFAMEPKPIVLYYCRLTLPMRSGSRMYSFPSLLHSYVKSYCC